MAKHIIVSPLVTRRLPRYYRCLSELMSNGVERISSHEFAQKIGFTASQIRQDLNRFGGFGQQGYGYNVSTLHAEIGRILSVGKKLPAILVGAGNLGIALANHMDFVGCGFELVGVFDVNPAIIGHRVNKYIIRSTVELDDFCREHKPVTAVLCVPKPTVPELADRLVRLGIKCFWNFTQYDLSLVYPDLLVEDVQLGDSLMTLSYQINERLSGKA